MPRPLIIDTLVDLVPLAPKPGLDNAVPAPLYDALLGNLGTGDGQTKLYAVIDAAQVTGLVEMLENQQLNARCLYKGDALETHFELAPWIVELTPHDRLLRAMMTASDSPDTDAAWHLWRRQVGIFIRSAGSLDAIWQHLRKYVRIREDGGGTFLFRFFEPDFLSPLLMQADPGEIAGFFAPFHSVTAIEQPRPGTFAAKVLRADPDIKDPACGMVLTRRKYRALQLVEYNRRAHKICADHDIPAAQRPAFVDVAVRLQTHGFNHDTNLVDAFAVLRQIDHAHHASVWKTVAEGQYSLGFILYRLRQHFGLQGATQ